MGRRRGTERERRTRTVRETEYQEEWGVTEVETGFQTSMWRFLWRARWSEREKLRSQSGHWKGLIPVCFRKCLVSSSDRANFHVQPSQVHL